MLIQSFTDWTQWLSVFQKGKEYLWGFLDACSMSDDAP
jgi:pyrroloquinoline quinone (PQQ) biosynthesis protein C